MAADLDRYGQEHAVAQIHLASLQVDLHPSHRVPEQPTRNGLLVRLRFACVPILHLLPRLALGGLGAGKPRARKRACREEESAHHMEPATA